MTINEERWSVGYIDSVLTEWYAVRDALPNRDQLLAEGRQMFIEAGLIKE